MNALRLKPILCSFLIAFTAVNSVKADPCDSLEILYVGYNPIDPAELIVFVHNTNELVFFSYPGFKLIDTNGDTVAAEVVNFFGIGEYSAHQLQTDLQDYVPGSIFNGTLLLYTGFYDTLVCTFPVSEALIPLSGCTDFTMFTTNYSGNIHQELDWTILDEDGEVVTSGTHDYAVDSISYSDSICLENGCYQLVVTADLPLEASSDIGIRFLGFPIDTSMTMNAASTTASFPFSVYYCDSTVSVHESIERELLNVFPNPATDYLTIEVEPGNEITGLIIYDLAGKKYFSMQDPDRDFAHLPVSFLPPGMFMIEINTTDGIFYRKFMHRIE